jgi:hypothetical protein
VAVVSIDVQPQCGHSINPQGAFEFDAAHYSVVGLFIPSHPRASATCEPNHYRLGW